ncbi:MAG TPA: hypothetical protein VIL46_02370 [Gemmataceae bacterium]
MRGWILTVWLLVPVGVAAWHYGPGQDQLRLDDVSRALAQADAHAAARRWAEADAAYGEALRLLPASRVGENRAIRLKRAKVQMMNKKLPEAHRELIGLVEELQGEGGADPALLADARSALASARYYMTWLMRLEGEPKDVWGPEIEAARQTYKLLAHESVAAGDEAAAEKHREDLEAAVRLARMELSELQGLPLPSQ